MKNFTQKLQLLIIFGVFWTSQNAFSQTSPQTYSTSGTYSFTVPDGVTKVQIECWGAGGGGGGIAANNAAAAGGAGGGYVRNISYTVIPNASYTVVVGKGGIGGTYNSGGNGIGGNGGQSYFSSASAVKAVGGLGGATTGSNNSGATAANATTTGNVGFSSTFSYYGGAGASGAIAGATSGGGGGSAGTGSNGNPGILTAGGIVVTGGGAGGAGVVALTSSNGSDAPSLGGGGGGARTQGSTDRDGGDGYDGKVVITWVNVEIDVTGNSVSIPDNDVTPLVTDDTDFGGQYIFTGSTSKTFTIKNTAVSTANLSAANLKITSLPAISGTNASEFTITSNATTPVAGGSATTFTVKFDPNGAGTRTAVVTFVNNDSDEGTYNFTIQGTGNNFIDSDGDGVTDNLDYDDDNDGIIDSVEEAACKVVTTKTTKTVFLEENFGTGTAKVDIDETNPGATCAYTFETSQQLYDNDYVVYYKVGGAQNDATNVADFAWYAWTITEDHTPADVNGRMGIFNASTDPKVFYENTITGIVPNIDVTYEFYAKNIDNSDAAFAAAGHSAETPRLLPNIKVEFVTTAGAAISGVSAQSTGQITRCTSGNSCTSSEWKFFTFTANLGSLTAFKIRLSNTGPGGLGNDLAIDDIVVSQKYCDLDIDGEADLVDLDDDNDGIPDVVEAGFADKSSKKSCMDRTDSSKWKDTSANDGMNDYILSNPSNAAAVTTYKAAILDTDGDGVYDFMDLDSDNDSIFDIDEAQTDSYYTLNTGGIYNGDGDIDGDGLDEGADTDGDGIKDSNDDSTGYGTINKAFPTDSDSDAIPDYRDRFSASTTNASPSVTDISKTIYSSLDATGDGKIDGSTDVDRDGINDNFDSLTTAVSSSTTAAGSPRNITTKKLYIDFDGRNDYAEGPSTLFNSATANATIMGWIKLSANYTNNGIVFGNDNFYINIDSSKKMSTVANTQATSTVTLLTDRWYHIAAVYDGSATDKITLYLNGVSVGTATSGGSTMAANTSKFTIAKKSGATTDYFRGFIDEVRVFAASLTADQIQKMIYQEIQSNGTAIRGAIVSKDIESTTWSTLRAYYRMDDYKNDVADDYTIAGTDTGTSTSYLRIYNVKYLKTQTAPMPFLTRTDAAIATSITDGTNFINGQDIYNYNYSIIKVQNNVTASSNLTGIGLIVDSGKTISVDNDNKIENSWYLELNGKMDLIGKSQLVQTTNSSLVVGTNGSLERDQQGTGNRFNYNYWSSPVSTSASNGGYTVASVMKDGTNTSNILPITWTTDSDGWPGSTGVAVTLSSNWIYKFQNVSNAYANWSFVGETGSLLAGQGYTLKGANIVGSSAQNYTFTGKPNNGDISVTIAGGNLNLSGNPYPSALDTYDFINDNLLQLKDGVIYFWEHSSTNSSHVLSAYQGGYAYRNLLGGVPPVVAIGINGVGNSAKVPGRYMPVGQGFFIEASAAGGTIMFKNSQRQFKRETDLDNSNQAESNTLFRNAELQVNNVEDVNVDPTLDFSTIMLGFNTHDQNQRSLLLGFTGDIADDNLNQGYDAPNFDDNPSDMYFIVGEANLIIQGVGEFTPANIYPLGVKTDATGNVEFLVKDTRNFPENQDIFIYDAVTNEYHTIKTESFEIELEPGTYNDRFSLRFVDQTLGVEPEIQDAIKVAFANATDILTIQNDKVDTIVEAASLFNIVGQQIKTWDLYSREQKRIEIPVNGVSAGTYIVKIKTNNGNVSKKIIIK